MASTLDELVAEVVEIAENGNAACSNKKKQITPHHLTLAIRNDEKLSQMLLDPDSPVVQANNHRKKMELKLVEALVEKETTLEKELSLSKDHTKQYCDMAESYEKQLLEINKTYSEYVDDLETEILLDISIRQLMAGDSSSELLTAQTNSKEIETQIGENNREPRELRMTKTTSLLLDVTIPESPVAQADNLIKEMELKLAAALGEKETLEKELSLSKHHTKQYCEMAESYKKQLSEINENYSDYKARVEADLTQTKKSEANLKQRVNDLETEISLDVNIRQLMVGDSSPQLLKALTNLKEAETQIGENNRELRELREKSTSLASALKAVEQKYLDKGNLSWKDSKTMTQMLLDQRLNIKYLKKVERIS